jgi:hypothetical protein
MLCRADTAGADCARRLRDALAAITDEDDRSPCMLHRDVVVYSELYQLSFFDRDFLANLSNTTEWVDVTNPSPVPLAVATRFDEWVTKLLSAPSDVAAGRLGRWAVGEAPWLSSRGAGTGRCTSWRSARWTCRRTTVGPASMAPWQSGDVRSAAARWA